MNKLLLFHLLFGQLLLGLPVKGQMLEPISWSASFSKEQVALNEEVYLLFKVKVDDYWYLYSNDFEKGGPLVSQFTFGEDKGYELIGEVEPLGSEKKYDDIFEQEVSIFKKEGVFRQKIKLLKKDFTIAVDFRGQACSEVDGRCILVKETFSLDSQKIQIK